MAPATPATNPVDEFDRILDSYDYYDYFDDYHSTPTVPVHDNVAPVYHDAQYMPAELMPIYYYDESVDYEEPADPHAHVEEEVVEPVHDHVLAHNMGEGMRNSSRMPEEMQDGTKPHILFSEAFYPDLGDDFEDHPTHVHTENHTIHEYAKPEDCVYCKENEETIDYLASVIDELLRREQQYARYYYGYRQPRNTFATDYSY